MGFSVCGTRCLLALFLISAIPLAFIISLELAKPSTHVFHYHSSGFFRECSKWDGSNRRFLVSRMEGGVAEIRVPDDYSPENSTVLREVTVVNDLDVAGNASLGLVIDRPRNRLLVTIADVIGNRYSALAAYDLSTWKRLFLAQLSGPGAEKSFADDVAVDPEGNAYVTDVRTSKIWKVDAKGKLKGEIISPLFTATQWYKNLIGLNGIVYHPDGFLLVIHTFTGNLYKVEIEKGDGVNLVNIVEGSLAFGDGIELISPTKLVVAGSSPSGRLVQSLDGWGTASVVGKFKGPAHRLASAATVKDGKVYLNHIVGMGYPRKKHAIVEAVFSS